MIETIHIASGGEAVHAYTSDDDTNICPTCVHSDETGSYPECTCWCRKAKCWMYLSFCKCDHYEEATIGQRNLL